MSYGPQLPSNKSAEQIGPTLPPEENDEPVTIGPVIPKEFLEKKEPAPVIGPVVPEKSLSSKKDEIGPQIPTASIGPVIPEQFLKNSSNPSSSNEPVAEEEEEEDDDYDEANAYGPAIPKDFQPIAGPSFPIPEEPNDDIGPMPVSKGNEEKEELERLYRIAKAREMEEELKNAQPKREEWMTSVPKKLNNFGLGARTFRTGTVSELDSSWEDAPGAKKKRVEQKTVPIAGAAEADARKAAIVAEKIAGPSLVDLHQNKRRDEAKQNDYKPNERRPFDREKDMAVSGLKPGAGKETIDRMKQFASRFANGSQQKYL